MHGLLRKFLRVLLVPGLLAPALAPGSARGDDTSFLGRIFRLGGNSSPSSSPGGSGRGAGSSDGSTPLPYGSTEGSAGSFSHPATNPRASSPTPSRGAIADGPATPEISGDSDSQPRVTPRPRASSAVTSADPLLTRMALGRSNDGSQFGMFLQIFADGTVIDSEGVHKLGAADLRPIAELIQGGELARVRGHCSSPSADFVEYVHIVVFERRMGRLQAHSLSYSGNPQGCDHSVRQLHTVLESLQAKLSRQPVATAPMSTGHSGTDAPGLNPPPGPATSALSSPGPRTNSGTAAGIGPRPVPSRPDPGAATPNGAVIPLSPLEPR